MKSFVSCFLFTSLMLMTSSCATIYSWIGDDEEDADVVTTGEEDDNKSEKRPKNVKPVTIEELELKLAKAWARITELERDVKSQNEHLKVLENGLTLGVIPEALKRGENNEHAKALGFDRRLTTHTSDHKRRDRLNAQEKESYEQAMAKSHGDYRDGHYGRAARGFSEVHDKYGGRVDTGASKFWLAKSWVQLKEYNMARRHLREMIEQYPESALIPRGKFEMARVELKQGFRGQAIEGLRAVVESYPYSDVAEMAKMELDRMEHSL